MKDNYNWCDDVEMYALGGMDAEDQAAFEQHMQTCPSCAALVEELQATIDLLPLAAEDVPIPSGMKDRVLGNILGNGISESTGSGNAVLNGIPPIAAQVTPSSSTLSESAPPRETGTKTGIETRKDAGHNAGTAAGAAGHSAVIRNNRPRRYASRSLNIILAAAVIGLVIYGVNLQRQVDDLHTQLEASGEPVRGLKTNEAVSLSAAAKDIVAQGLATIVIDSKGTHLLVQAEKLPQLEGKQAFQVWLMKDGQQVKNAGTFVSYQGTGALYFTLDQAGSKAGYNQIAITLEPDADGELPRGTPVLSAEIHI